METTSKRSLQVITEGAIIVALATALNYLPHGIGLSSVQFEYGLVPIVIFGLRRGVTPATLAGLTWGLLDLILRGIGDGSVLNPVQGFLEYPIAFSLMGLVGFGSVAIQKRIKNKQNVIWLATGYGALGVTAKYVAHFVAGGFFWGAYAPKSMNPWIWSTIVNGGSAIVNIILLLAILLLLSKSMKRLLLPK